MIKFTGNSFNKDTPILHTFPSKNKIKKRTERDITKKYSDDYIEILDYI